MYCFDTYYAIYETKEKTLFDKQKYTTHQARLYKICILKSAPSFIAWQHDKINERISPLYLLQKTSQWLRQVFLVIKKKRQDLKKKKQVIWPKATSLYFNVNFQNFIGHFDMFTTTTLFQNEFM